MAEHLAILALELSHFMILLVILLQCSTIFTILLSHFVFCYNELNHFCDPISHFSLLQYSAVSPATVLIHCATVLRHFAILLSHFLRCSTIL
jgi:hypothetical protein